VADALRVGILGFGGAGQAHLKYFDCVDGCQVTKIYDAKPSGLDRARAMAPGVAVTGALDAFWSDLDAVSVCTPDATHADYIVAALERGLHVLCEKPLTDSTDGVRRILAAERRGRATVAVVHQMRFVPLHQKIRRQLEAGALGVVSYMEGYYVHDLRERAFVNDDWRRTDNATPLVYSGCHMVDLLRWFAGADDEVVEVFAAANHRAFPEYPESDLTLVTLRFRSGLLGKVLVAFGSAAPQDHSVRVHGTEAAIENNVLFARSGRWQAVIHEPLVNQPLLRKRPGAAFGDSWYAQWRRAAPSWLLGRGFAALRLLARRPNAEYAARFHPLRLYEHSLACVGALDDFVQAVRRGHRPLCTTDEAARTVLVCLAGVESYRANRPVRVRELAEITGTG
jgi:UDP-N-acetyl-2-amino-2-deoxyglucuronate dehydrogenase